MKPSPMGPPSISGILSEHDKRWMGMLRLMVVSMFMKLPADAESISTFNRKSTPESCTVTGRVNDWTE